MIVDAHTHILPDTFRNERERWLGRDRTFGELFASSRARTASAKDLLTEMEASEIDVSIALGYGWTDRDAAVAANDYLVDCAATADGRIIPFCSANPAWGPAAAQEAERCLARGARGIGELHADTQGWSPGDFGLDRLMALAAEAAVPVVVHASEPLGHDYPGKGSNVPARLVRLAEAYPEAALVFAHFGGGLPFYALMPEVAVSLTNVYFDSAASPYLYRDDVYPVTVAATGDDRLMFGSDFPLLKQGRALRAARAALDGGPSLDGVLGTNAASLLGLLSR